MTEKETPTIATDQPEAQPQAQEVAAATEAQPETAGGRLRLVSGGFKKGFLGSNLGRLLGVLLFIAISATAVLYLKGGVIVEEVAPPEPLIQPGDNFPSELGPSELVLMAEGALENQDIEQASRYFEEARVRAERDHPDDVNLAVDVFEGLATVAEARGRPRVAELYHNYIHGKQAELGTSLPIFSEAERLFRAQEWRAAKANYAKFLLTRATLGPAGARYVAQAKSRLAQIWEQEFKERSEFPASLAKLAEPERYFDGKP